MEFTIEAAYTRKVETSYFAGSAPDGFAQLGDSITMTGRQTPEFDFGDGRVQNKLVMSVTSYSVREDWILGKTTLVHNFDTINNNGAPFQAKFTGCCRFSGLVNNADAPWELIAEVDLGKAIASPRASTLPMVSVPYSPEIGDPRVTIPAVQNVLTPGADGMPSTRALVSTTRWSLADPWNVGNAVSISGQRSSLQLDLSEFSSLDYMKQCTDNSVDKRSVSPGCFFRLIRTDHLQVAMTVEGWVRIRTAAGGVVLSTGKKINDMQDSSECSDKGICQVALIYVKVDATHITVGHEHFDESEMAWKLGTSSFDVASNPGLVEQLNDPLIYAPDESVPEGTLTKKWVHVAVVRQTRTATSGQSATMPGKIRFRHWYSTYKVYVNGFPLGIPQLPSCGAFTTCQGGERSGTYEETLEVAESNPIPGPRLSDADGDLPANENFLTGRCSSDGGTDSFGTLLPCVDAFGSQTALIFGGYRGAAEAESEFDGILDEWRFWNGERSRTDILSWYKSPIKPKDSATYGDPTDGGPVTIGQGGNYKAVSVLMANYNMDWEFSTAEVETCPVISLGCKFATMKPIFPESASAMWVAQGFEASHVRTDTSGVMFFKAGDLYSINEQTGTVTMRTLPNPGFYQVTVLVMLDALAPRVPVDFIIEVVDASFLDTDGYRLCRTPGVVPCKYSQAEGGNQYMPTLEVYGPLAPTGDSNVAVFRRDAGRASVDSYVYPKVLRMHTGFNVSLSFLGKDRQMAGAVKDWRDTKVGFSVGPVPDYVRFSTVHTRFSDLTHTAPEGWEMGMSWTPCPADVGDTVICLDAVDYHLKRDTGVVDAQAASEMKCVRMHVLADPAPEFDRTLTSTEPKVFVMGQEGFFDLHAADENCLDDITIAVEEGTELPPGAVLHAPEPRSVTSSGESGAGSTCTSEKRRFSWKPDRNMGGFKTSLCFTVTDSGAASTCEGVDSKSDSLCLEISVARCKYALQQDQQLQEIASMFGMDWMRLWSLNQGMMHPDYIVYGQQVVNVGHLYKVATNDRIDGVAKRMGMSPAQMAELNYDVKGAMELQPGQELCVVPDSCEGMSRTIYSGTVFENGKFFNDAKMQHA